MKPESKLTLESKIEISTMNHHNAKINLEDMPEMPDSDQQMHEAFMREALIEAKKAGEIGEVPIGAVIVQDGKIIARGHNRSIIDSDPTAHAEIVAIREACRIMGNYRLPKTTLYVTLEPCTMCAGSFLHSRIETIVYGAGDSRNGALGTNLNVNDYEAFNHKLKVIPRVLQEECSQLIKAFFKKRRAKNEE